MAFNDAPTKIILNIPKGLETKFGQILKLAVLKGLSKEQAIAEFCDDVLTDADNAAELAKTWLTWDELEKTMSAKGFTLNRTTVWKYERKGKLDGLVRGNNSFKLYHLEGFLKFFE